MCECVRQINEALAPSNGRLAMAFGVDVESGRMQSRLVVGVEKIDKKKRQPAPLAVATFCPFCGEKLHAD